MSASYSPLLPSPLLLPPQYGYFSLFAFWMGGAGLYEEAAPATFIPYAILF